MSKLHPAALPLFAAFAITGAPAHAEWRCDCTRVTGSCEAGVEVNGDSLLITSDQRACSRVEYYLDGQPFVALVVDGARHEAWPGRSQSPEVLVQSCQLCADQLDTGDGGASMTTEPDARSATPQAGAPAAPSPDTPLIQVAPAWPAGLNAQRGDVTVELNVGADGVVTQARVLEAKPRGAFDQAALDAVRRWRYAPGDARTLKVTVPFEAPARAVASENAPGPRNACVREANVDDLVDIVQVQLINACADAVLVRTCTVGFAERAQQWVCDGQPLALVARGDALNGLLGETTIERGRVRFGYIDESYLSRPTGSRYAWIACAVNDAECNGAALRWTEYLNAKPSDVDPSAGSEVAVAVAR